ncbi:hypothetical protein E4T43_04743, partial [Aureobasidium subglaciale]
MVAWRRRRCPANYDKKILQTALYHIMRETPSSRFISIMAARFEDQGEPCVPKPAQRSYQHRLEQPHGADYGCSRCREVVL